MQTTKPIIPLAMIETLVMAIFAVIVAFKPFGLTIDQDQQNAVIGLIAAAYAIILAVTLGVQPAIQSATRRYVAAATAMAHENHIPGAMGNMQFSAPDTATLDAYLAAHPELEEAA